MRSRKILVPCDGSKPSVNALTKAVELFSAANANANFEKTEIILLYVVPYIEVPSPFDESGLMIAESPQISEYIKRLYSFQKEHSLELLNQLVGKLINKDEFDSRIEILHGSPAERITEFAQSQKVDIIVMGNVGLGGLSKLKALGSVSRSVCEQSEIPVMVVPYLG